MLENEISATSSKELMLVNTQDAIDDIEDYTSKMFKVAQLISEDFFNHYQNEREKYGLFNERTMMAITYDLTGNNTLFEIILDYLGKISGAAETAGKALKHIRKEPRIDSLNR